MFEQTTLPSFILQKRAELASLCEQHGVMTLALFGSALREDFDPTASDLDFLVEFYPMEPVDHKRAYFGLLEALETLFGRRVDLVEGKSVRNPYLKTAIETAQEQIYAAT